MIQRATVPVIERRSLAKTALRVLILVGLPVPPSKHAPYANETRHSRTQRFRAWRSAASWQARLQAPRRVPGPVAVSIEVEEGARVNLDAIISAPIDLLCDLNLIEGDHRAVIREVNLRWGLWTRYATGSETPAMSECQSRRNWTRAMSVTLIRMRRAGRSYEEIAARLGVPLSAAIAKAVFTGLARATTRCLAEQDERVLPDEPELRGPVGDVVGDGLCRWIRGDIPGGAWRMCGHPVVSGKRWCSHHVARVFATAAPWRSHVGD